MVFVTLATKGGACNQQIRQNTYVVVARSLVHMSDVQETFPNQRKEGKR